MGDEIETWDLWYPGPGATGLPFARARLKAGDAGDRLLVHAAPQVLQVTVRDQAGSPIAYVHVTLAGSVSRTVITNADGGASLLSLPDGIYRVRFEHERFVTLERELTVRNGQPSEFEVEMSAGPAPTLAPAAPEPPPPLPPSPTAVAPSGPPVTLSIPAFLDKNFIGREPLKESVVGCTAASTTRVLQLREPIATLALHL